MDILEQIGIELNKAIQKALAKHTTKDLPGLELHGELRGLLQHVGRPDTAIGFRCEVGKGLPQGWRK